MARLNASSSSGQKDSSGQSWKDSLIIEYYGSPGKSSVQSSGKVRNQAYILQSLNRNMSGNGLKNGPDFYRFPVFPLPARYVPVMQKIKNKQKGLDQYFSQTLSCASDGNRTRTDIAVHGILSPACLPIPPPKQSGRQR